MERQKYVSHVLPVGGGGEDHRRQSDCILLPSPHDKPQPFYSSRNHEGLASHMDENVVDYFWN